MGETVKLPEGFELSDGPPGSKNAASSSRSLPEGFQLSSPPKVVEAGPVKLEGVKWTPEKAPKDLMGWAKALLENGKGSVEPTTAAEIIAPLMIAGGGAGGGTPLATEIGEKAIATEMPPNALGAIGRRVMGAMGEKAKSALKHLGPGAAAAYVAHKALKSIGE